MPRNNADALISLVLMENMKSRFSYSPRLNYVYGFHVTKLKYYGKKLVNCIHDCV